MYENNLEYHCIENFKMKSWRKELKKQKKNLERKLDYMEQKKGNIGSGTVKLGKTIGSGTVDLGKTIGSGTVDLGKTIGSGTVDSDSNVAEDNNILLENEDNNILLEDEDNNILLEDEDNNILLEDEDIIEDNNEGSSITIIVLIGVAILLLLFLAYYLGYIF